jgi:type II secretory pathway component GspD/PulD (secretin)
MNFTRHLVTRLCAFAVLFCALQNTRLARADSDSPRHQQKEKAGRAAAAGDEEQKRIIRVYLVDDLLYVPSEYPYRGSLPAKGPFEQSGPRSAPLGSPMGGGGAGGGMGGGGMFSIPDSKTAPNVLRQFGGGGPATPAATPLSGRPSRAAQLINLIKTLVKGEWEEGADQCVMFGNNLVVRATPEAQQQIDELLKSLQSGNTARSVTVEATWIVLDGQKLNALRATQNGPPDHPDARLGLDPKQLSVLSHDSAAFRGQLTCLNGQTVHFATGQRRVVASGATPTVGVGAAGYSTSLEVLNIGAVLQVTPMVASAGDRHSAILDLHSVVTQWGKPGEPIKVTSQSVAGMSEKSSSGTLVHHMATIDRVNVGTQEWSTTIQIPLGVPVLVGAATLTDGADQGPNAGATNRPELGLVIEVRPNF